MNANANKKKSDYQRKKLGVIEGIAPLQNRKIRDTYINKTDVIDKVKPLKTMPPFTLYSK